MDRKSAGECGRGRVIRKTNPADLSLGKLILFDYKLLAALAAVVEQGGFERAAQALGLSQSAVSQRITLLEARVGQPVLVRETPPHPTDL
ncbi:LysR family transcriptional regulator, partial [Listeria monocytogenes]|nr:LysR family transcriptional regulator [Listeria monocytogenes]